MSKPHTFCEQGSPAFLRFAGVPPTDRMVQSPAFPQGEASNSALRAVRVWQGPIGGCPGEKAVVSGRISSLMQEAPLVPGDPLPSLLPTEDNEQASAALPVKLRIERSQWPGWVIFDSDRSIVLDAGETVTIDALVPANWFDIPSEVPVELAFFQFVSLRVRACLLRCCPPPTSRLTWFAIVADASVFVRPRGAKSLQITGPGSATAGSTWLWYNGDPVLGGVPVGGFVVAGGFVNTDIRPGSASHLQLVSGGGTGDAFHFEWEVEF